MPDDSYHTRYFKKGVMPTEKNEIGSRYEYYFKVCELVEEYSDFFNERTAEFADRMRAKLAQYHERAFITTSQISWLNRIQQELKDRGVWVE